MTWNRNRMYEYLKQKELKPLFYKKGNGYHVKYVLNMFVEYSEIFITIGGIQIHIRDFYSISLCMNEIVIMDEMGNMKINFPYRNIEDFEVYYDEQ